MAEELKEDNNPDDDCEDSISNRKSQDNNKILDDSVYLPTIEDEDLSTVLEK